ncbi:GNAT family N-acetyltransferase [Jeotgalibacillus soli]|uniref:Putative N-acetyltransferase n=1 Tax=Jeotgalibacillus soli TaxID=889306 RepID=A0A0C2VJE5_9BACL|nr:GNAT family N-acetyltransferase [Jeotgalibacillus soli]KIL44611.1 putative N-acetyltransferase [Jeotgalibacillus soli]
MKILSTERLILREFNEEDARSLHPVFSDEETMKFYPAPLNFEQTKEWIKRNQDRYKKNGFGLWAVCLKEKGELIGDCGLIKQVIDDTQEVEVGYHINRDYWSQGFGSETVSACMQFGFNEWSLKKLISIIDPHNAASVRVAEKNGFTKEKEVFIFKKNHYIYSIKNK